MDPNTALTYIRNHLRKVNEISNLHADMPWDQIPGDDLEELCSAAYDLAAYCDALDRWLVKGGFLPKDWEKKRKL